MSPICIADPRRERLAAAMLDLIVRGATVIDGSGEDGFVADTAVADDRIAGLGDYTGEEAREVIDGAGMVASPGFINVLSHSYFSMLHDPRSLGELKQGVTTQIFGEAFSMGPLTDRSRSYLEQFAGTLDVEISWTRLSEYLDHMEKTGVTQNVASLIGTHTLRINAVGFDDRPATDTEIDVMRNLVAEEMADGALGIGSALVYAPGSYASTEELISICRAAEPYGGRYFSHLRNEGNRLLQAIDELLTISRAAEVPAEVWHLKTAGMKNWELAEQALEKLSAARDAGSRITADMYPYTAGATSLAAAIPPPFHSGGVERLLDRLRDRRSREEMRAAMLTPSEDWEDFYLQAGAAGILILGVTNEELRHLQGKTLEQVAASRSADPLETLFDLVLEGEARVFSAYFMMSEENVRRNLQVPWISFGSDAASMAPEGKFLERSAHPRAYGTFARVLGKYVRDEGIMALPDAIRRMTDLPAKMLGLEGRGRIAEGHFADLVVFDPAAVADVATYEDPHRFAVGIRDVVVNGQVTLRGGEFTGTFAGRALSGPGKR